PPLFKSRPLPPPEMEPQKSTLEKSDPLAASTPKPQLAKATPPPLREVKEPNEDELAIAEKPKPTPGPVTRVMPMRPRPLPVTLATPAPPAQEEPQQMAKLITPSPRQTPSPQSGYQSQQEQTKIDGSITNK